MADILEIHPRTPQPRLIRRVVEVLRSDGLIVYPTDSSYAFGWTIGNKAAQERVAWLRQIDQRYNFTLVCRDLSEIATYAKVENYAYRLLKSHTPGPYTFILPATREVPRRSMNPKRKSVGIRVPDDPIAQTLLDALGEPLMSSSLILPNDDMPMTEPSIIADRLDDLVDLVVDGGTRDDRPTTVVDLLGGAPEVLRFGKGVVDFLQPA